METIVGIDVGNSRVKIVEFAVREGASARTGETPLLTNVLTAPERTLGAVFDLLLPLVRKARRVHVVSVDPAFSRPFVTALRTFHFRVQLWGDEAPLPMPHPYGVGKRPGDDRVVAAIGARRLVPNGAAIVVDAGTAVTVDLVSTDGHFLGGAIAPGLRTMTHALGDRAAQLMPVAIGETIEYPATTTARALEAGIFSAWSAGIRDLVRRARVVAADAALIVTGGDAERLMTILESEKPRFEPHLLALGLLTLDEIMNVGA